MQFCHKMLLSNVIFWFAMTSCECAQQKPSRISMDIASISEPLQQSGQILRRVKLRFKNTGKLPFRLNFEDAAIKPDVQKISGRLINLSAGETVPHAELNYAWEDNRHKNILAGKVALSHEAIKLEPQSESFTDCEIQAPAKMGRYELLIKFDNRPLLATSKMHNFFQVEPIAVPRGQEQAISEESTHYPSPYFETKTKTVLFLDKHKITVLKDAL